MPKVRIPCVSMGCEIQADLHVTPAGPVRRNAATVPSIPGPNPLFCSCKGLSLWSDSYGA
jgi:hypothetical protein